MWMFINTCASEILFLGRLTSVKVDSRFLFDEILTSLRFMNKFFSLMKKPVPP